VNPLDDNPSAPPRNPSASQTAGKIFFQYKFNPLNLIIFYQRSESLNTWVQLKVLAGFRLFPVAIG
jgi:hypothetical protein